MLEYEKDSESDNSFSTFSVDELYEVVANNSKSKTYMKNTPTDKISTPKLSNLNNLHSEMNEVHNNVTSDLDNSPLTNLSNINHCDPEININDIEIFEFGDILINTNDIDTLVNENEKLSGSVTKQLDIQEGEYNKESFEGQNIQKCVKDLDVVNFEEIDNSLQNVGRKRHVKSNPSSWNRNETKSKRLRGEAYLGYRRKDKKNTLDILHDTPREERKIGPPCQSTICEKWKTRNCLEIKCEDRLKIFNSFWKEMTSWREKQIFVLSLIEKIPPKQRTTKNIISRRNGTYLYYLKIDDCKLCVCRNMFLSTFGLKESTVRYWLENKILPGSKLPKHIREDLGVIDDDDIIENELMDSVPENNESFGHKKGNSRRARKHKNDYLVNFLNQLPKLPSHYCRQSTRKLFLQTEINSVSQLYNIYCNMCKNDDEEPLVRKKFVDVFNEKNLSIFSPKKDQCDLCCQYKVNNLPEEEYQNHISRKNQAREEKTKDKLSAEAGECHVFSCDLMAVQLLPYCQANAIYYKMKLAVHNYTVYNLGTHEAICYWFDESQCELVASTFASCLTDIIEETLKKSLKQVIIYSDGCTAQNRNSVLSNALLHLSIKYKVNITQKYLEKGHTQMECDSVHSVIERKLKRNDYYLPCQLSQLSKESRLHPFPYKSKELSYTYFSDYTCKSKMIYDSIRPGRTTNDPVVTDLRVLQYCASGVILFKLNYNDTFQELPRRPNKIDEDKMNCDFPKLYKTQRKISLDKWNDLQSLKTIMPYDCHLFYDSLPHMDSSLRKSKNKN